MVTVLSEFMCVCSLVHYITLFLSFPVLVVMFIRGAWAKVIILSYFGVLRYDTIDPLVMRVLGLCSRCCRHLCSSGAIW